MQIFSLPKTIEALLFDIDNTLYSDDRYVKSQIDHLIEQFAAWKRMEVEDAGKLIEAEQRRYAALNGGKKTSLGNTMLKLGVSIEENARWRDELFDPEEFLEPEGRIQETVRNLSSRYALAAVTNNTAGIGRRTLRTLGLETLIPVVVGLDTCYVSKPAAGPYRAALTMLHTEAHRAVSIGDRFSVDIETPLSMGMGGVLIENLSDVYELPGVLLSY